MYYMHPDACTRRLPLNLESLLCVAASLRRMVLLLSVLLIVLETNLRGYTRPCESSFAQGLTRYGKCSPQQALGLPFVMPYAAI